MAGLQERTSFFLSRIVPVKDSFDHFRLLTEFRNQLLSLIEKKALQQLQVFPCRRQYLTLWNCVCLAKLPQVLPDYSFLVKIYIAKCPELASFPETTLPSCLSSTAVESCDVPESLPVTWTGSTSLMYIARKQLSPNLKQLQLSDCDNLQVLMEEENNNLPATLEYINIYKCLSIVFLSSNGNVPKALKFLSIFSCPKLETVAETFDDNIAFKTIIIRNCQNLKFLPNEGWLHCANLKEVNINSCDKLEALPNRMHQLNHLQTIEISSCSILVSFPEEGFPSLNVTSLVITDCEKLHALAHHIQYLTSLQSLAIDNCPGIKSFPEDGFPTYLASPANIQ